MPQDAARQVEEFAICTGRLSALMEHQWMTDGPGSEETALRRAGFASLVEAVLPDSGLEGRAVLALRIEAKMAHAMLLQQASFGTDPVRRAWAQSRAVQLIAQCDGMLLG